MICRIFKKTNISAAQRAASSAIPKQDETMREKPTSTTIDIPLSTYDPFHYFEAKLPDLSVPSEPFITAPPPMEMSDIAKSAIDVSSILFNISSSLLEDNSNDPFTSLFHSHSHGHSHSHPYPDTFSSISTLLHQQNASLLEYSHYPDLPLSNLNSIWDKLMN